MQDTLKAEKAEESPRFLSVARRTRQRDTRTHTVNVSMAAPRQVFVVCLTMIILAVLFLSASSDAYQVFRDSEGRLCQAMFKSTQAALVAFSGMTKRPIKFHMLNDVDRVSSFDDCLHETSIDHDLDEELQSTHVTPPVLATKHRRDKSIRRRTRFIARRSLFERTVDHQHRFRH